VVWGGFYVRVLSAWGVGWVFLGCGSGGRGWGVVGWVAGGGLVGGFGWGFWGGEREVVMLWVGCVSMGRGVGWG
jgi:hypothetical protein